MDLVVGDCFFCIVCLDVCNVIFFDIEDEINKIRLKKFDLNGVKIVNVIKKFDKIGYFCDYLNKLYFN